MIKLTTSIFSLLFLAHSLFAQRTFTLDEAVAYALQNHNSIQNARLDELDARFQIRETAAIGIPQLNGEMGYQYNIQVPVSVLKAEDFPFPVMDSTVGGPGLIELPQGVRNNLYARLELTSLAFDWSYIIGLKAAKKFKELVNTQVRLTEQQVTANVRESYIATLLLDITETTLEKNISNVEELLYETEEFYKNGFVERLDVLRLQLSISNLKNELNNLREQKKVVLNLLKYQMNFPIQKDMSVADNMESLLQDALSVDLNSDIDYSFRKEIEILSQQEALNDYNVKRIRAGYYPNLSVFAGYQQTLQGNSLFRAGEAFWRPNSYVGFRLNVPIFDGFEKKNSVARAEIAIEKIKNNREDLFNAIHLQVNNARIDYRNKINNMNQTQMSLDLANGIYNDAQYKYQEGVGSSLEVSQAEQALYQAQSNHNKSLYDVLIAKANLDKALGK